MQPDLPQYLQLEPVGQCNLRCKMCPIQFRDTGPPHGPLAFMDFELFRQILDDLPQLHLLHLQGLGEPLMHPRFFDMVRYASERGIEVTTNTNATLINERRAELCVEAGLSVLNISFDGATKQTYESIRVRSHFDRVLRNIEAVVEARERRGSKQPRLNLVLVLMRSNLEELPDVVALAAKLGFAEVAVQQLCHDFTEGSLPEKYRPMQSFVAEETLLSIDDEQVEHVFAAARDTASNSGIELHLPRVRPRQYDSATTGRERCDWPWTGGYVSFDGWAMPCCMISTPDRANFGRVTRETSFAEIWRSQPYESFRARLDSVQPPDVCASCALYNGTF